jgi:hypothetical protein
MEILSTLKLALAEHYQYTSPSANPSFWNDEILSNGIHISPQRVSDSDIFEIDVACRDALVHYPNHIVHESNRSDRRIYGVDRLITVPALTSLTKRLYPLACEFYGTKKINYFCMLGEIKSTEKNIGSGSGWHRDSPFRHQFKSIIYLTDVNDKNGPFEFIPCSHNFSEVKGVANALERSLKADRFKNDDIALLVSSGLLSSVNTYEGPAGTVLYADTRGLHRGKPLVEGIRRAITFYFYADNIPEHFILPPENS